MLNNAIKIFLTVLLLASCESPTNQMQAREGKSNLPVINIGRLICGGHLPLAVVEKKYQQQLIGFQLNTMQNHDWDDVISDMTSGKLAGSFMLSPLAMNLIHEGFAGKIVLMANRNGNAFVLSHRIQSINDLKKQNTVIAVPHVFSQHNVLLHMLLQQHNIPEAAVKVLGMPPRDMINALRNGDIDGFVVGEPEGAKSISLNVGWLAATSPTIWKGHMDHVFIASDHFINEQPEFLQGLINQLVRAGDFIEKNPRLAAIMGEAYTGSKADIFEKVLTSPPERISYSNMVVNKGDMDMMAEKMVAMKLWPAVPKNIKAGYFDMRFAEQAQQLVGGK